MCHFNACPTRWNKNILIFHKKKSHKCYLYRLNLTFCNARYKKNDSRALCVIFFILRFPFVSFFCVEFGWLCSFSVEFNLVLCVMLPSRQLHDIATSLVISYVIRVKKKTKQTTYLFHFGFGSIFVKNIHTKKYIRTHRETHSNLLLVKMIIFVRCACAAFHWMCCYSQWRAQIFLLSLLMSQDSFHIHSVNKCVCVWLCEYEKRFKKLLYKMAK